MAFTVKLTNFTGTSHFTQVDDALSIEEFKQFLAKYMYNCKNVALFKNSREIKTGTIGTNFIKPDDTLNVVCTLKTGFDLKLATEMKKMYEDYNTYYTKLNEMREEFEEEINLYEQERKEKSLTPLEMLSDIQREREITIDDYQREDMRILFQRCRDQIEDEAKKMKQTEKENARTKQKLEELKKRMSQKKRKSMQNKNEIKKTFGGLKKGFLLK